MNAFERAAGRGGQSPDKFNSANTRLQLEQLKAKMAVDRQDQELVAKSLLSWRTGAQERMRLKGCSKVLASAQKSVEDMPAQDRYHSVQNQWRGRLRDLNYYATREVSNPDGTKSIGQPLAVLRFINMVRPELTQLAEIPDPPRADGHPGTADLARQINAVFRSYEEAIGSPPQGVNTQVQLGRIASTPFDQRGRDLVRIGVFVVAGGLAIITGILALFAKEEDRNWKIPGTYLLIAALALGWGEFTRPGSQRLADEVGFLTRIGGGFEGLQERYGIRGPGWGSFARRWYEDGRRDPEIAAALKSKNPPSQEQRKAILALSDSPDVKRQLEKMLASTANGNAAVDFKTFITLLNAANSQDGQGIVINFLQNGASRADVAFLRKLAPPGTDPTAPPVTSSTTAPGSRTSGPAGSLSPVSLAGAPPVGPGATPPGTLDVSPERIARVVAGLRARAFPRIGEGVNILGGPAASYHPIDGIDCTIGGGRILINGSPLRVEGNRGGTTWYNARLNGVTRGGENVTLSFDPILMLPVDPAELRPELLAEILVRLSVPGGTHTFPVTRDGRTTNVRVSTAAAAPGVPLEVPADLAKAVEQINKTAFPGAPVTVSRNNDGTFRMAFSNLPRERYEDLRKNLGSSFVMDYRSDGTLIIPSTSNGMVGELLM